MLKFSKSKHSRPSYPVWTVVLFAILTGFLDGAYAQTPSPPPKTPHAYVRFWNMLPDTPANNLTLLAGEKNALAIMPPGNFFAEYMPVPVGNYNLMVRRMSEASGALQTFPATMADRTYITLLATEKNGQPTVQMFNDTPDPKVVEAYARFTMRQFVPGARVKVSVVGGPSSPVINYGETAVLENVPPNKQTNINLQAAMPTTPPTTRNWTLTGDFSAARHATLLLVADSYGRFRPLLAYDGQLGATPDPTPAASP